MLRIPMTGAGILAAAILALPAAPLAATMSFAGLGDGAGPGTALPYVEDGISATPTDAGTLGYEGASGAAHLDAFGTPFTSGIAFTMASPFDFVSLDVTGFDPAWVGVPPSTPFDNVKFEGFRGGSLVDEAFFSTGNSAGTFHVSLADLGGGFVGLDELRVINLDPTTLAICSGAPCLHVDIDNLTLSPVPLPTTLPMLLAAIVTLVAGGTRLRARA